MKKDWFGDMASVLFLIVAFMWAAELIYSIILFIGGLF